MQDFQNKSKIIPIRSTHAGPAAAGSSMVSRLEQ